MRRKWRVLLALLAVVVLLCTPPFATLRSMGIMSAYSAYCERNSIEKQQGFSLEIPGGMITGERDWYPLMLFFDASSEFSRRTETETQLNIYYTFGAYDIWKGCSQLYDPQSPYYTSFYGAYVVQGEEYRTLDLEKVVQVMEFDLFELVLDDFGLDSDNEVFEWTVTRQQKLPEYIGVSDWLQIDADVTVNGAAHIQDGFRLSYLQYGAPGAYEGEAFAPVALQGRMIGRYFEEWDCCIFFYILAADENVLEACDRRILSRTTFHRNSSK